MKINEKSKSCSKTFESGDKKVQVIFVGEFIPRDPGVHTFRNGDPGYPPDGPYFTIENAEAIGDIMPLIDYIEDFYDKIFARLKEKYKITWHDWECFTDTLSDELADELEGKRYEGRDNEESDEQEPDETDHPDLHPEIFH